MNCISKNCTIAGIATCVPHDVVLISDISGLYGGNKKTLARVQKATGFYQMHVTDEKVTAADLCEHAARFLLSKLEMNPNSIDCMIFVCQTPDHFWPASSCILQHKLGLSNVSMAFDVNQGCAAFTYGVQIASALVANHKFRTLLLVGDTPSRSDFNKKDNTMPIFGDAGSAAILEYDAHADPIFSNFGVQGENYTAIIAQNGGYRNLPKPDMFYSDGSFKFSSIMDGLRVMEFTLNVVPNSIREAIQAAGLKKQDIDYYFLHQANGMIIKNIADDLEEDIEKFPSASIPLCGNTSAASIPLAMCLELSTAWAGAAA